MKKRMLTAVLLLSVLASLCVGTAFAAEANATPTNDSLICDGVLQTPTVYKINGSNYFKIRDLAAILNGSGKQFNVGYDGTTKSVTAIPGEGYTKLSNDLTGAPSGGNKRALPSNDTIYINGALCKAEVYKIDGMNYFKLRDLGQALDFYVGWDDSTKTVALDTTKGYEANPGSDSSDSSAMARAMLAVLDRDITDHGCARLMDVDGDGVKELIVLKDEDHATLYDWNNGQLSAKSIGAIAGGSISWWLCRDTVTGELGIEYIVSGISFDDSAFYYPSRSFSLTYNYDETGSSNYKSYRIDYQEVPREKYTTVRNQNRRLEKILSDSDYYASYYESSRATVTRGELECMLAGKTIQYISDAALFDMAKQIMVEAKYLGLSIANADFLECDSSDFFTVSNEGWSKTTFHRVIGYQTIPQAEQGAKELWYSIYSRRGSSVSDHELNMFRFQLEERNGKLYRRDDGGVGDGGGYPALSKMISRTTDEAVFSAYWDWGGERDMYENDFQFSLVFEDGTWKYLEY